MAAWGALMGPLTIILHETGHFLVALSSGLAAELHPMSVSGGAEPGAGSAFLVGLQSAAGPLATIAMSLAGARLYASDPSRLWALAAAVAAVSRLFVTTAYLAVRIGLAAAGRTYGGNPNFDEANVAVAIGLPVPLLALVGTSFLFGLLYWLLRHIPKGRRLPFGLALVAGISLGIGAWAGLAPAVLLAVPGSAVT